LRRISKAPEEFYGKVGGTRFDRIESYIRSRIEPRKAYP